MIDIKYGKVLLLKILCGSGLFHFLRFINRKKIIILMVHGVVPANSKSNWKPMREQTKEEDFFKIIELLSRYYTFIDLYEAIDILLGKKPPINNAMVISFDDGYNNNFNIVKRLREEYKAPSVVFVTAGNISERTPFWFDRIDYALQHTIRDEYTVSVGDATIHFDIKNRSNLTKQFALFRRECKKSFENDFDFIEFVNRVCAELEVGEHLGLDVESDDYAGLFNWKNLNVIVNEFGAIVGSHAYEHLRISHMPAKEMEIQLKKSKEIIEKELKVSCDLFCYPNGDYNQRAIYVMKSLGYKAALSVDVGMNAVGDDVMTLKRYPFPAKKDKASLLFGFTGLRRT